MDKKTVEVVTSFYKDGYKLDWKDSCKAIFQDHKVIFSIYRKRDDLEIKFPYSEIEYKKSEDIIDFPNIGRCDYNFLYHIIKNYDCLSDVTVFTKVNWKDQKNDLFELIRESVFYDFAEVGEGAELQIWDHDIIDLNTESYVRSIRDKKKIGFSVSLRDNRITEEERCNSDHPNGWCDWVTDWYNKIFPNSENPGVFWTWSHGPCFSVSRDLIKRHDKDVYIYLLERFHPESGSWNIDLAKKCKDDPRGYGKSERGIMDSAAHHYHDELLRFWRILFTHDLKDSNYFKIKNNIN
jgi:hypothetical protein